MGQNETWGWGGTWAAASQWMEPAHLPPPPGLADTTLRQIVRVSRGGARLRVHFSNTFGAMPLIIAAAHVAGGAGGHAIYPDSDQELAFSGQRLVTIPPGASVASDPVAFPLAPLSDLAITIHVLDSSQNITGHPGARCTAYLRAGNAVSAPTLPGAATTDHWYYLSGVDVAAAAPAAVVTLGDSLTDGRGSTPDGNGRWPDALARRLQANPETAPIGVLNAGIGGNRVCRVGLGPCALARLDRDVLEQPGVRWVIVLEGINDLGTHAASALDLIAAYRQIILRAHARGLRVYGGTLTPCGGSAYFDAEMEAARQTVNHWIRTGGSFDAVVDFEAATRNPQAPSHLRAVVDSGDHLHLNDVGYQMMADSVDLRLLASTV